MNWDAPKNIKCGENISLRFGLSIQSSPYPFTRGQMTDAYEHAKKEVEKDIDKYKKEVTEAANKWVDNVKCSGTTETCKDEKCQKMVTEHADINDAKSDADPFYEFHGRDKEDGKVICLLKVYSGLVGVSCGCENRKKPWIHVEFSE